VTQDPIGLEGGVNAYSYPMNPVDWVAPLGLNGCYVLFPDYPIEYAEGKTSTLLGGHGGVFGYDSKGNTEYYEYGRYNPSGKGIIGVKLPTDEGNIRRVSMPNLKMDENGQPTKESLENLKSALSNRAGKGTRVWMGHNNNTLVNKGEAKLFLPTSL